ncbi:hypothetical protein B8V81_1872 [Paenibacillus pasadenensis]|uniref:Uncharacterized protein n=1 Tax=Paenibacillus pasadenensis TaxID=217090 RepID=A0A2N5NBE3_9BACL|nr:hypothetical protein B8V81_1872 [Paenibacillus pasadenensis]
MVREKVERKINSIHKEKFFPPHGIYFPSNRIFKELFFHLLPVLHR